MDTLGVVGNTIKIFNGRYFDFVNPNPNDLDIETIAIPLSRICRFGGHTPVFLSVAEHCYWAEYLARIDDQPIEIRRAAFMHDAVEALVSDMVKPLKCLIGKPYEDVEARVEAVICERFNVDIPKYYSTWKAIDWELLIAERNALWEDDGVHWPGSEFIKKRMVPFEFWGSEDAATYYLDKAKELGIS
jgi:hypothetical protein